MTDTQQQPDDVSHETSRQAEARRIAEMVEKIVENPPPSLTATDFPNITSTQLHLLSWHVHTWSFQMPVTVLCEIVGCSRETYYVAMRNKFYLGYLARGCRNVVRSKAPDATREYLRLALRDGDRIALERILLASEVLPPEKHINITDPDEIDEPLTDEESKIVAQGLDALLQESGKQETETDQRDGVDGSPASSDSQESDS